MPRKTRGWAKIEGLNVAQLSADLRDFFLYLRGDCLLIACRAGVLILFGMVLDLSEVLEPKPLYPAEGFGDVSDMLKFAPAVLLHMWAAAGLCEFMAYPTTWPDICGLAFAL